MGEPWNGSCSPLESGVSPKATESMFMASFFLTLFFPLSNRAVLEAEESTSSSTDKGTRVGGTAHWEYVHGFSGTRVQRVSAGQCPPHDPGGQAMGTSVNSSPLPTPPKSLERGNWGSHAVRNSH